MADEVPPPQSGGVWEPPPSTTPYGSPPTGSPESGAESSDAGSDAEVPDQSSGTEELGSAGDRTAEDETRTAVTGGTSEGATAAGGWSSPTAPPAEGFGEAPPTEGLEAAPHTEGFGEAPPTEGLGAAPPTEGFGATEDGTAAGKRSSRIVLITAAVVILLVALFAGLFAWRYLTASPTGQAKAGVCLDGDSINQKSDKSQQVTLKTVKCTAKTAKYKVVGRVNNKKESQATDEVCNSFPDAEFIYWEGQPGKTGFVLCLATNAQ